MLGSGALVAGTRAGSAFNTFPLMNGRLVPTDLLVLRPTWTNLTEDLVTVQFQHRFLALVIALVVPAYAVHVFRTSRRRRLRMVAALLVAAVTLRVVLGVLTVVNHVPVVLGSLHQATTLALFLPALLRTHQVGFDGSSADGVPGVDRDDRAGHVAGGVGGQEHDDPGDLLGSSESLHRDGRVRQAL